MALIEITAPEIEPVTVAEVKAAARVDNSAFDGVIAGAIKMLTGLAQDRLGRRLITQTVELVMDAFPCDAVIDLLLPDVQSIVSVKYLDADGSEVTLASTAYVLAASARPCRLVPAYGVIWPSTRCTVEAVRVRFNVGYGAAAADVPEEIRQWIIAHAVQLLDSPSGLAPADLQPLPFVDGLLDGHRIQRFV